MGRDFMNSELAQMPIFTSNNRGVFKIDVDEIMEFRSENSVQQVYAMADVVEDEQQPMNI